ncbi:hypothetical protein IWW38_000593 [Coemansia aciculifera]|uniref:Uncharacterized protein n=1 Tax=Coemansia aciculifera TaxID=417176 RepID=A0ACC1MAK1_9FUNG|nr:hypothetical protein IWW38_000593 [Coemansia aciculifera]
MPFPDPLVEDRRAAAALAMGIHSLDKRQAADLAVVSTISVVYFVDLIAVLFMLWNRKYPPIKAKSPVLMAVLFLSSALWFVGDVQINGHVTLANSILTNCRGLGVWVRILVGMCGVCAVFALRSFALYHVFCLNMPYRGIRFYLPVVIYALCILTYGVVTLALKSRETMYYLESLDLCLSPVPFKASIVAFVWITLAIVAFNYWRIRNIKSSFNESREMAFTCLLILANILFATLVQFLHPQYPLSLAYRVTSTILNHLCTNVIWWGVMAVPLWNCLFHRQKYLDKWVAKLRMDGLQREYDVDSASFIREQHYQFTPADIAMNEAVLRRQSFLYKADGFYYANEGPDDNATANVAHERTLSWLHSRDSKDAGFGNDRHLL